MDKHNIEEGKELSEKIQLLTTCTTAQRSTAKQTQGINAILNWFK